MVAWVEPDGRVELRRRAVDLEPYTRRLVGRERIEHAGDLARYPSAHEHVIHSGEHRAVQDGEIGKL